MNNDKLQRYALIAEIVGGIAVLATLILIAFELRTNTITLRASTYDSLVADMSNQRFERALNTTVSEGYLLREEEGREELSPMQAYQRREIFVAMYLIYERAFVQWKAGNLDDEAWERFHRNICQNSGLVSFERNVGNWIDLSTTTSFKEYRLNEC